MALLALASHTGPSMTVHHVDHGLRPRSDGEADVVAAYASKFGARFEGHVVTVEPGSNLEARARAARYGVLPAGVLTGHTADDQAETVIINILRGAALDGLTGMRFDNKPLLALRRSDTHGLCQALGLEPIVDESNGDERFLRNRVRHEVLPALNAAAQRDLVPVLDRQALLLRDDAALLENLSREIDPTDARALSLAPSPLARRAIRRWLKVTLDDEQHPPAAAAVERVRDVARGQAIACDVSGGWEVRRSQQRLHLQRKKT